MIQVQERNDCIRKNKTRIYNEIHHPNFRKKKEKIIFSLEKIDFKYLSDIQIC